jgi:acyl-CoA synthetase (AMP-forming)/AMP-acid ligase II
VAQQQFTFTAMFEAVAGAYPERECIIFRDLRLTYADVLDRSRRLAHVLADAGLGARSERDGLAGHESHQDHIGLYLHNGNEYLEGMLGAYAARVAPFNVNYRYVAEELLYLLRDSGARGLIFHSRFAPVLAEILDQLPDLTVLLQVADGSGEALLDGALDYEAALAAADPGPLDVVPSPDDLYILYTGGTTGMPKGVLWRQADFIAACLGVAQTTTQLVETARTSTLRALPAPPFMHGAAHWNAISAWIAGGTVVIQDDPVRLDPADVLATIRREQATSLLIVGDAFARPLVDELRTGRHDASGLRFLLTGGATLSASVKDDLLELLPDLRIVDVLGSSETGRQGVHQSDRRRGASTGTFERSPTAMVLSEDRTRLLEPGDDELGWLTQTGRVPLAYLGDAEKTARTFPVVDGVRHAIAGDRARVLADGSLELHGRDSVTINTGGEKVFAEEVEQALKRHPAVFDAVVVGRPSERWGQEVVAVVQLRPDQLDVTDAALRDVAGEHVARYKVPKAFVRVPVVVRSPSGKPDYRWAAAQATAEG